MKSPHLVSSIILFFLFILSFIFVYPLERVCDCINLTNEETVALSTMSWGGIIEANKHSCSMDCSNLGLIEYKKNQEEEKNAEKIKEIPKQ